MDNFVLILIILLMGVFGFLMIRFVANGLQVGVWFGVGGWLGFGVGREMLRRLGRGFSRSGGGSEG